MKKESRDERYKKFIAVLGDALSISANEVTLLARLEEFFDPIPAKLVNTESEKKELQKRVDTLVENLGGPPKLFIIGNDEKKPKYDTYPTAAMSEILNVFHRVRRSVTRTQLYLVGSNIINEHPELLNLSANHETTLNLQEIISEVFWEHAETSFIRLSSYWDRVGQFFDFVFFRIRQFERDGFAATMDRIHNNITPIHSEIKLSIAWKALRKFQISEQEDGLKWLLRRRNLIIHSLHLQPMWDSSEDNELFESAFNHLEIKLRDKLKPGLPKTEIERIHLQLSAATDLFKHVITLCEMYVELTRLKA